MSTELRTIHHLFWRAGMGLTPAELTARSGRPYADLVDELFRTSSVFVPLRTEHTRASIEQYAAMKSTGQFQFRKASREATYRLNALWRQRLITTDGCLREKMAFFWHGHFAAWSHWSTSTEQYINVLREHALGDLGTLLKAVSRSAAMLDFLNNHRNRKDAPNENFARELMELFTLGRGHYTEQDIHEAARAFTGWSFKLESAEFDLHEHQHDDGPKTFRGHTGAFDGDDILDLILADKRTAEFICGKVYRCFVDDSTPDPDFIARMADRFYRSTYNIADLMRFVFLSEPFRQATGKRIKSPVELLCGLDKQFRIRFERDEDPIFLQRTLGQLLLYPPNVAGWPVGEGWIDSQALMFRLKLPAALLNQGALEWDGPTDGSMANDMMMDLSGGDAPMRDGKGRVFRTAPDKAAFLAQLGNAPSDEDLFQRLLLVEPSRTLRANLSGDVMQRVLEILSTPEYQLC